MKEQVAELVNESIKELGVFVDDAYISNEEGKKIFNIVLDSEEIIDLNKITDASRIINKIMDEHDEVLGDIDELDISNLDAVLSLFEKEHFDAVINPAAFTKVLIFQAIRLAPNSTIRRCFISSFIIFLSMVYNLTEDSFLILHLFSEKDMPVPRQIRSCILMCRRRYGNRGLYLWEW